MVPTSGTRLAYHLSKEIDNFVRCTTFIKGVRLKGTGMSVSCSPQHHSDTLPFLK